jgi:hypothetical protein
MTTFRLKEAALPGGHHLVWWQEGGFAARNPDVRDGVLDGQVLDRGTLREILVQHGLLQ